MVDGSCREHNSSECGCCLGGQGCMSVGPVLAAAIGAGGAVIGGAMTAGPNIWLESARAKRAAVIERLQHQRERTTVISGRSPSTRTVRASHQLAVHRGRLRRGERCDRGRGRDDGARPPRALLKRLPRAPKPRARSRRTARLLCGEEGLFGLERADQVPGGCQLPLSSYGRKRMNADWLWNGRAACFVVASRWPAPRRSTYARIEATSLQSEKVTTIRGGWARPVASRRPGLRSASPSAWALARRKAGPRRRRSRPSVSTAAGPSQTPASVLWAACPFPAAVRGSSPSSGHAPTMRTGSNRTR